MQSFSSLIKNNKQLDKLKTYNMKRYLLIFALLFVTVSSWGLGSINTILTNTEVNTSNLLKWTLLVSKDNVKVFRAYTVCSNNLRVFLKVENNNPYKVKVSWQSSFNVSGTTVPINKSFSVDVELNSMVSGNCENEVLILNPYLYVTSVREGESDYQIQDLKIEKL